MALQNGDILQLALVQVADGVNCACVMHLELVDVGTAVGDNDIAANILDDIILGDFVPNAWAPANSADVNFTCAAIKKILPTREITFERAANVPGDVSGDNSPSNSAVLIRWGTATRGRGSTGRNFFCAPPESFTERGNLNALGFAAYAAIGDFWETVVTSATDNVDVRLVVLHSDDTFDPVVQGNVLAAIRKIRNRTGKLCPV